MLTPQTNRSIEGAYVGLLEQATEQTEHQIGARGNHAREVIGVGFRLPDPRQRLPYLRQRKVNPVFQFAEALWHLAGRRDLAMLVNYAPTIASDSHDGVHLDGSAYGHVLFTPAAGDTVSPFDRVMNLLREEKDSKRGYLPVFAPTELVDRDNPSVSCLAGLHLLPRDGRLHMVVHMRANDLDCGLLSDAFSFTMIQEYAAIQLGLKLGSYTHYIGSAHVNDGNADRAKRVIDEARTRLAPTTFAFPAMPDDTDAGTIARVLEHEELLRTNRAQYTADDVAALDLAPYWQQAVLLFELHRQIKNDHADTVTADVLAALWPGLRWLASHRWEACAQNGGNL
ncbi:thymidylate synthase [Actinacidiphila glaucinigra]|uniref:thymidylate synthase n=1 Tax=Actinacidiphila glaucinigra TaxID=235986 RepID=UPI0033BAFC78